ERHTTQDDERNRTQAPRPDALVREDRTEPHGEHGLEVEEQPRHVAAGRAQPIEQRHWSEDAATDYCRDQPPPLASLEPIARSRAIAGPDDEQAEAEQASGHVQSAGESQWRQVPQEELAGGDARRERERAEKDVDPCTCCGWHPHGAIGARA